MAPRRSGIAVVARGIGPDFVRAMIDLCSDTCEEPANGREGVFR